MEVFKILEQIATFPIKLAKGLLEFAQKGHTVPINATVMVDGKKLGAETRIFLFEDEAKKGQQGQGQGQQNQPAQP